MKCLFEKRGFEIPLDQWHVLKWLLLQTHGMDLEKFMEIAMTAGIREVVRHRGAKGKPIPQFVVEYLEKQKVES